VRGTRQREGSFAAALQQSSPSNGTLPLRMTQSQSEHAPANGQDAEGHSPATFWALALGWMGVVFGDIGTSPLYAFKVALEAAGALHGDVSRSTVLRVPSLILWALLLLAAAQTVVVLL